MDASERYHFDKIFLGQGLPQLDKIVLQSTCNATPTKALHGMRACTLLQYGVWREGALELTVSISNAPRIAMHAILQVESAT